MSSRALLTIPQWLLALVLVVVIPLAVVGAQALIRRRWPVIVQGEHNDVAGFLIAVVGVLYGVTLAFFVLATWEDFEAATDTVSGEAGALRAVLRDSGGLPEPNRSRMRELVISYADEVSTNEWEAMDGGRESERAFDLVGEMFATLETVRLDTPTQAPFLADALTRLDDVVEERAARLDHAREGAPSILWWAITVGAIVTIGFALLFGVSNERLHYVMIGGFAGIIMLQIFVILVLNYPFTGDVRVSPEPIAQIVADFR